MKILVITPFFPPDTGGISYHVENITKRLAKRGHKIIIVSQHIGKHDFRQRIDKNIVLYKLASFTPLSFLLDSLRSFRIPRKNVFHLLDKIEEKNNIDCVYVHGHHYPCLLYTSPSPRDLSTSRMPSSA